MGAHCFPISDGLGTLPDREELAALGLREIAMEGTEQEAGGEASALLAGATAEGEAARPIVGTKEKEPAAVKGSGKEKGETLPAEPFLLSKGLPPVPAKLVAKIQRGEYVDMTELLRDNIEATRRRLDTDAPHCSSDTEKNRREIPDFLSWLQCFGVYASIVVSKQPDRYRQLMAYQTLMVREARRCGGTGWLAYDAMFRQQAAHAPGTDWSKLNTSLYTVTSWHSTMAVDVHASTVSRQITTVPTVPWPPHSRWVEGPTSRIGVGATSGCSVRATQVLSRSECVWKPGLRVPPLFRWIRAI